MLLLSESSREILTIDEAVRKVTETTAAPLSKAAQAVARAKELAANAKRRGNCVLVLFFLLFNGFQSCRCEREGQFGGAQAGRQSRRFSQDFRSRGTAGRAATCDCEGGCWWEAFPLFVNHIAASSLAHAVCSCSCRSFCFDRCFLSGRGQISRPSRRVPLCLLGSCLVLQRFQPSFAPTICPRRRTVRFVFCGVLFNLRLFRSSKEREAEPQVKRHRCCGGSCSEFRQGTCFCVSFFLLNLLQLSRKSIETRAPTAAIPERVCFFGRFYVLQSSFVQKDVAQVRRESSFCLVCGRTQGQASFSQAPSSQARSSNALQRIDQRAPARRGFSGVDRFCFGKGSSDFVFSACPRCLSPLAKPDHASSPHLSQGCLALGIFRSCCQVFLFVVFSFCPLTPFLERGGSRGYQQLRRRTLRRNRRRLRLSAASRRVCRKRTTTLRSCCERPRLDRSFEA